MKKVRLIAISMAVMLLAGCESDAKVTSKKVEDSEKEVSDENVVSAEEFNAAYPDAVILPESVKDVEYTLDTTSENPISEVTFSEDNVQYVLKVKKTDDPKEDITGMDKSKKVDSKTEEYTGAYLDSSFKFCIDNIKYQDGVITTYVSTWNNYVNGVSYNYALFVWGKNLDDFDITVMVKKLHDCYLAYINKLGEETVYNPAEFPDGKYFADVSMIRKMAVEGDTLIVDCARLYPRDVEAPDAIYAVGKEPFVYSVTITGDANSIACVQQNITGVDENNLYTFEETSYSLDKILKFNFNEDEPSPTELVFELQAGKIVKITVY